MYTCQNALYTGQLFSIRGSGKQGSGVRGKLALYTGQISCLVYGASLPRTPEPPRRYALARYINFTT